MIKVKVYDIGKGKGKGAGFKSWPQAGSHDFKIFFQFFYTCNSIQNKTNRSNIVAGLSSFYLEIC